MTGACLCGGVRFEVDVPLRDVIVCHCSLCRRSGTNAAAYTAAPRGAVRFVTDELLATYVDPNQRERSFCRVCGSTLLWAVAGDDEVSISAGALDGDTGLRIARHIHADSAADWESVPPGVPVHGGGSDSPIAPGADQ